MPTLSQVKKDQVRLRDELEHFIEEFNQISDDKKDAAYRAKQGAVLSDIQLTIEKNNELIVANTTKKDEQYEKLYVEVLQLIEDYQILLETIPLKNDENNGDTGGHSNDGTGGSSNGGTGGNSGDGTGGNSGGTGGHSSGGSNNGSKNDKDEYHKLMKSQQVRIEGFLKICRAINRKKHAGEVVSSSFGKIKISLINSSWERIAIGHEVLGSTGTYPQNYMGQMAQCEGNMEESLLYLQEAMDTSTDKNDGVKLERVTIPKFNGDYFKWVTFRDLFVSLVVDNKKLSKATKLQMLKTNVTGEPEYLISDLTIADVNFDAAWGRLTHRYENKRVIVNQHLSKFMTQAPGKWESKSLKRLLDTTDQILLALGNLGRPIEYWDDWIVFTISQKFSEDTRKDWEKRIGSSVELPTWDELKAFLEEEFRMLESVENTQRKPQQQNQQLNTSVTKGAMKVYQATIDNKGCVACGNEHKLFSCTEFKKMKPKSRWELAKRAKLCFSCLKPNHDKSSCTSDKSCKKCNKPHSTWLHEDRGDKQRKISVNTVTKEKESSDKKAVIVATTIVDENVSLEKTVATVTTKNQVLLATALILTYDVNGHKRILRALIDSGSQGSLITAKIAESLQYTLHKTKLEIAALGRSTKNCAQTVTLTIRPHFDSAFEYESEFYVMQKLTRTLPDENLDIEAWKHLRGLQLADPTFHKVGPIDILLGADVVAEIIKPGLLNGEKGQPIAQQTQLGWIISGKVDLSSVWLKKHPDTWPNNEIIETNNNDPEKKAIVVNVMTFETNEIAERTSSWFKLIRITAYCLRMRKRNLNSHALTTWELKRAADTLIRQCQQDAFPEELAKLQNNKPLLKSSRLLQLDPFLDENAIMRVGGRLQQAPIAYENRHPAILPANHKITTLIIQQMHFDTLHGGAQMMLGLLRKKYWILNAKRKTTGEVRKCVHCIRLAAQPQKQQMGILPSHRVSLVRAFLHSGVDYCGPFEVKSSNLRNAKKQKAYIAVFVCFATKAFHLELISDQTTEAFLAAFNRFIARRGLCETMYSDNGGNFTKGASVLERQQTLWLHQRSEELKILLSRKGIEWKFIPPESPNMGGLWERGVRSVKHHLKRTLQNTLLTFEEYNTILCQVEACLNSRPLCPLTNELETLNALTPGHFLIGDALMAPPQPMLQDTPYNTKNRWRHLQLIQQHFWNRWHKEYLSQLQSRQKWKTGDANLKVGDVVLLKDEDLPPRQWLMGIIEETFPGPDNKVRVVMVRTHTNGNPKTRKIIMLKRAVRNLVLLLPEEEKRNTMKPAIRDTPETVKTKTIEGRVHTCRQPRENLKLQNEQHARQNNPKPTTSYNLRPRKVNLATTLFTLMICAIIFGGGLTQETKPIHNTEFTQNSGIYLEDIGRAQVIRSNWHIYIQFDLGKYYTEFKRLQEATKNLQENCIQADTPDMNDHCIEISNLLSEKMDDMKQLNVLIKSNGETTSEPEIRISKRAAPLNIVGWASNQLFGIMAADQAEHIEKQIDLAKGDRQHLLELIKKQTTLVENTVNLVKRTHDDINQSYSKIDTILSQMQNESSELSKKEKLMGLALYTSLLVNRFEGVQQNIVDLVTDIQKGHISIHAFTPRQLKEQLVIINNNLPSGSKLFEDGQDDVKSVYKMMQCTTRVTNKNLLVHLSIPLVSVMDYQMYHIIPIPTKHQGNFVSIIPESKYLMITLKKDSFYQLSDKEKNTCIKPGPRATVCNLKQPAYNTQSGRSQCERDLLEHKLEFSEMCKFNITQGQDFWLQLQRKNSWIYSLKKSTQLSVVCDQRIHTIRLKEAGIIELDPGCEAIQPGMTITAESDKVSEGNFTFIPTLDFSKTVATSEGKTKLRLINTTINHADQLNSLHEQIKELHAQSRLNKHFHYVHHGTTIIMFVTLGILILLIWIKRQWLIVKFTRESQRSISTTNLDNDVQRTISQEDGRQGNPRNEDNDSSIISYPVVPTTKAVVTDNK